MEEEYLPALDDLEATIRVLQFFVKETAQARADAMTQEDQGNAQENLEVFGATLMAVTAVTTELRTPKTADVEATDDESSAP